MDPTTSQIDIRELNDLIQKESAFVDLVTMEISKNIVGQKYMVERLLLALLANGHILLEGVPGLAKTLAIRSLASTMHGKFSRIQFTPDLLPADLVGTMIYNQADHKFVVRKGPVFANFVLADEINRAPAKVQAAMLEAMAEKQISAGRKTYRLPELFLVMATQNPIEQEGTYPLPEAQLDRFLLHLEVNYPNAEDELAILRLNRGEAKGQQAINKPLLTQQQVFSARQEVLNVHMAEAIENYLVRLVMATRHPANYDAKLAQWLTMGVSPRATIALDRCARAHAWLQGRDFVTPDDIQAVFHNALRHRLILTYAAEAEGISTDDVLSEILRLVPSA